MSRALKNPLSLKGSFCFLLFLLSGFLSAYIYYTYSHAVWMLNPGIVYTSATVIVFILTQTTFTIRNLLIYYLLMVLTYLVIFIITVYSSWVAVICGHFTAAAGALLSCMLVNKFIKPIQYNKWRIAGAGALSFLLTVLLKIVFSSFTDKFPLEFIFKPATELAPFWAEVFIFWQLLTGMFLFRVLEKNKKTSLI
jgi:hypothetical protein